MAIEMRFRRKRAMARPGPGRDRRLLVERLEDRLVLGAGTLLINEFMASNNTVLQDGDGNFPDWIEIHNPTDTEIDLAGWYLTDDAAELTKWQFPAVSLAAGDYLVVFASGQSVDDYVDGQGYLHTNFKLDADGESLALVAPDGATVVDAYWDYPQQWADISYGSVGNVLIAPGAAAQILIPDDGSLGATWTEAAFTPGPDWRQRPTGVGYDVSTGGGGPSPPLAVDFSRSIVPGPTQEGWEPFEHEGTSTVTKSFDHDELAGTGNSVDVTVSGQTHWRDYAPATGDYSPLSNLLSDGPLCNAPATLTLTLENLLNGTYEITTYHHTTQFGPSARPPATPFDIYLTDGLLSDQPIVLGAVMSDNNSDRLRTETFQFTVVNGSPVRIDFARGASVGEPDHFALSGFELTLLSETRIGDLVAADIETEMLGNNASAYLRIPFDVEEAANPQRLQLRMKYDDGFAAYLNGALIARRNAPGTAAGGPLTWDAAATAEHPVDQAVVFEGIDVSGSLDALQTGTNVLAIHGLNLSSGDEDFLILPELIATQADDRRYMKTPTPAAENAEGYVGAVADTRFSVDRGFFDEPFQLEITTETPDAEIRYTTDGSPPTETTGTVYTGPITIDGLTILRAVAVKPGYISTNVDTHTYIFLDDVLVQDGAGFPTGWGIGADYAMENNPADLARIAGNSGYTLQQARQVVADSLLSLPTLSIVMDTEDMFDSARGIYANTQGRGFAWERPTSVELIHPDGTRGFQEDAGIRIQGFTSRDPARNPKHSFRLVFRNRYGAGKLNYPFFGDAATDEFDTIILRSNAQDAWVYNTASNRIGTFARDQWLHETQAAMGQPAVSANYLHLYINGLYWGVYNPTERPDASFGASYFGGDKEDYDALRNHEEVLDGNNDAYHQLLSLIQNDPNNFSAGYRNLSSDEAYQEVRQYIDVDNLADYMIHNMYGATIDWPGNNYIVRNRVTAEGFKFFDWDGEHAFKTSVTTNRTGAHSRDRDSPTKFHHALRSNAEYRMLFADHLHRAFSEGGALYVNPEHPQWDPAHPEWNVPAARWMAIAEKIDQALIAEAARWGDYARDFYGLGELFTPHDQLLAVRNDLLTNWFPQRSQIVLNQFRAQGMYPNVDAPVFEVNGVGQNGGSVARGDLLGMRAGSGTVYYTFEGSDPRLPGGGVQGAAYLGPIPLIESVVVKARTLQANRWSALSAAEFRVEGLPAEADLVVTELNYNPYPPTPGEQQQGFEDNEAFEFLELQNVGDEVIDLTGMRFSDGIEFQFSRAIEGTQVLITEASSDFPDYVEVQNVSDQAADTSGWVVAVNNAANNQIGDVHSLLWALPEGMAGGEVLYRTDSPGDNYWGEDIFWRTTGKGWVMIVDEQGGVVDFVVWGYPAEEIASMSVSLGGFEVRPGEAWIAAAVPAGGLPGNSLQRSGEADHDDASDWAFSPETSKGLSNANLSTPFWFPGSGVELAAGEFAVLVADAAAFAARYGEQIPIAGQYGGRLRNGGERLVLLDRWERAWLDFSYDDGGDWPKRADGSGSSLELIAPENVPRLHPQQSEYLSEGENWRSSSAYGGSPGSPGSPMAAEVVINELLSHSHAPLTDAIELHNSSAAAIEVGGWYLSDSSDNYRKFRIPLGTTIPAGGYLVFDERDFNPSFGLDPELHPNDFALDGAHGDEVWLMEADRPSGGTLGQGPPGWDGKLIRFVDQVEFGAAASGESLGRWPNGRGELYPMIVRTLDPSRGENSGPRIGPLILSEVHYNPLSTDDLEFVEIYNPTGKAIDLTNWRIGKGITFDFAAGTMLAPGSTLVVVPFDLDNSVKLAAFRAYYGLDESVSLVGGYAGRLNDEGEAVQLQRPDDPPPFEPGFIPHLLEDEVNYDDQPPWPTAAGGGGESLHRLGIHRWGNEAASWTSAPPSPGVVSLPAAAEVVDRKIFYNHSAFDLQQPEAGSSDDQAVAVDKRALLPGIPSGGDRNDPLPNGRAGFANYTSYDRGINGIMVDVRGLPAGSGLDADDFQFRVGNSDDPSGWVAAAEPSSVTVRRGDGREGSDRVTLIWPDNAIQNEWLQVTVLASAATGLAERDVFYFGNAIGESGNSAADAKVNVFDMLAARDNQRSFLNPAPIDFAFDYNRDQRVNTFDMLIARDNQTHFLNALKLITLPADKVDGQDRITVQQGPARAVLRRPAGGAGSGGRETSSGQPNWLYEFEEPSVQEPKSAENNAVEEILDFLFAGDDFRKW